MKFHFRSLLSLIVLAAHATGAFSQSRHVEMRLMLAPEIMMVNGTPTAYLEYFVSNISNDTLQLKKLELMKGASSGVIASFDHHNLGARLQRLTPPVKGNETVIPPGSTSILYLELVLKTGKPGTHLVSVLAFETFNGKKKESHTILGNLTISREIPLVLGPPLKEGTWAAVYEPSWQRGHRRVLYKGDAGIHLPGRCAIDFIRVDDQGRYAKENEDEIRNWHGYGADVLAVSDGVVLSTRNDFPESTTLSAHHQPQQDDATGNYISLEIGARQVAFYEHLKPGSIRVRPGQRVKKGDVIASLGFTGQSTGPHLHFHVADRNSPLQAEGIPFVFERFRVLGAFSDMEKFGKEIWSPVKNTGEMLQRSRPAPNAVIAFH